MSRHVDEVAHGFRYLEGPRWYEGKLWLSDFYDQRIHTVDAQGNVDDVVEVPGQPSGLGQVSVSAEASLRAIDPSNSLIRQENPKTDDVASTLLKGAR